MNKEEIIEAFWEGVPGKTTLDEMANGIDVTFTYNGKKYTVNTKVSQARTRSIQSYYDSIERKAVLVVKLDV